MKEGDTADEVEIAKGSMRMVLLFKFCGIKASMIINQHIDQLRHILLYDNEML